MSDAPTCRCGSAMWDNRADKVNPKSPDFRCKDKTCGNVVWLDKLDKQKPSQRPAKALEQREHYAGPPLPNETPAEATGGKPAQSVSLCADWLSALDMVIEKGLPKLQAKGIEADASAVFAATAAVFIAKQAKRGG